MSDGRGIILPHVTLIIPVYSGEKYLAEAIESVLVQDYRPLELIVVDDGSVDATAEIAGSYPQVKCLSQAHGNVSVARNTGIAAASREFITFLDHDDLLLPGSPTTRAVYLQEHPETRRGRGRGVNRESSLRPAAAGLRRTSGES